MSRPSRIVGFIIVAMLAGLVGCKGDTPASKSAAPVIYPINDKSPHLIGSIIRHDERQVLYAKKGEVGFLLYGPYVSLHEGNFKVVFRLRADDLGAREVATLDVNAFDPPTKTGRVLSALIIRGEDFGAPDQFRDFALYFSTKQLAKGTLYEFRARSSGQSGLWIEQTTLQHVE